MNHFQTLTAYGREAEHCEAPEQAQLLMTNLEAEARQIASELKGLVRQGEAIAATFEDWSPRGQRRAMATAGCRQLRLRQLASQ